MKITASAAKLREWQRIRALDVRAAALMAAGVSRETVYVRAMDEMEGVVDNHNHSVMSELETETIKFMSCSRLSRKM